jgi:hypothetical protein
MLLLMDDTVLLATSREAMNRKLDLLYNSATELDMVIHPAKSQFLVINSDDKTPFRVADVVISNTNKYCYLGSPITTDSITKQVEEHVKSKQRHVCN